jgi:hypothetical protein
MMRTRAAFGIATAVLLASTSAFATDTGKGETGGKGGLGPGNSSAAPPGADTVPLGNGSQNTINNNPDLLTRKSEEKPWEVDVTFETHRMIRQDDLEGAGANKVFNDLGIYGSYNLSDNDRIGIHEFFTENFIADEGESGIRADDITATYTRIQRLPKDFSFSALFALSAPTSLVSQKQGLITAPSLALTLSKRIGRYVSVSARGGGAFFIVRYRETEGGNANPELSLRFGLDAEVVMPFYERVSIGASASTAWLWQYNVASGDPNVVANGVVQDPTFSTQPVQQSYGGELYARYELPNLAGVKSDFLISLAQGDPELGFAQELHGGIGYTYLFFRTDAEVYAAFTARY